MLIQELQIINFRNLRFLRAEFAPGINLIYGSNAQGKTNLLEAIYLLVTGRSFRTRMEREMIPWVRDEYEASVIRAKVSKGSLEERFLLTFNQAEKHVFVNGNSITRLGELIGRINAVLFTPSDLQLVRGGPGLRRRFLDVELSQISRPYLHHLQRYDLALHQRNALIKQHQRRPTLRQELLAWDEQLATHGTELTLGRMETLAKLSQLASEIYGQIANPNETLELVYEASPRLQGNKETPAEVHKRFLEALHEGVDEDIRKGSTSRGPHRDDFGFLISGRDARDYGSQGQQRSCVLALKLAELKLMEQATGEYPLLLLDDLMSELDESRKRALLGMLNPNIQTFVTATERELVLPLVDAERVFFMEDGELHQEEGKDEGVRMKDEESQAH